MSSSLDTDSIMTCMSCGASIYKEHIDRGLAGMWAGELLCPSCRKERIHGPGTVDEGNGQDQLDSLPLQPDDTTEAAPPAEAASAGGSSFSIEEAMSQPPFPPTAASGPLLGRGARGIRTFHAKLSEAAVRHMDEQVTAWLAQHPDIEIKFASTTVGVWEAKHAEPNLILTVFY